MNRKRQLYNVFEPASRPAWRVTRSMQGAILEARELPTGTDLKRVFLTSMLERLEGGWQIGEFSSASATFFCSNETQRSMVSIEAANPYDVPMYGGAHLAGGCPNCQD